MSGLRELQAGACITPDLKAPLAVDSDGVAGLKWTGVGVRFWNYHADVGLAEQPSSLSSDFRSRQAIIDYNCQI